MVWISYFSSEKKTQNSILITQFHGQPLICFFFEFYRIYTCVMHTLQLFLPREKNDCCYFLGEKWMSSSWIISFFLKEIFSKRIFLLLENFLFSFFNTLTSNRCPMKMRIKLKSWWWWTNWITFDVYIMMMIIVIFERIIVLILTIEKSAFHLVRINQFFIIVLITFYLLLLNP